jgi:hypothetical protein
MLSITRFVRFMAVGTTFLLVKTLESVYARCQSRTLRAIAPNAGPLGDPRPGEA